MGRTGDYKVWLRSVASRGHEVHRGAAKVPRRPSAEVLRRQFEEPIHAVRTTAGPCRGDGRLGVTASALVWGATAPCPTCSPARIVISLAKPSRGGVSSPARADRRHPAGAWARRRPGSHYDPPLWLARRGAAGGAGAHAPLNSCERPGRAPRAGPPPLREAASTPVA